MDSQSLLEVVHVVRRGTEPGVAIVVLHGWAESEQVMLRRVRDLDERLTVIVPRAPIELPRGNGWYWRREKLVADRSSFDVVVEQLGLFVASLPDTYGIDPSRLLVMGFSQGAVLAAALTRMQADRFAGTVCLSGPPLPIDLLYERPELMAGHPVFMAHGANDDIIPIVTGHRLRDLLIQRGADVEFREYGYKHEVTPEVIAAVNDWIVRRGLLHVAVDA